MSTSIDFIKYVCEQIPSFYNEIRYKKMFGEYFVYINDKPILLVCDDIVFIKKLPEIEFLMDNSLTGFPYKGAKEHYILDIDNYELSEKVINLLEKIIPVRKRNESKK